ncbi:MAG: hypothetical protein LQ352_003689 [Teloschistes flavicans]|nr:MAG: hypothetical protein LQ352_003689 [Teloschistes flavicans]
MICAQAACAVLSIAALVNGFTIQPRSPTRPSPEASASGDPSPDDITCNDYMTCSSKGLGYWKDLQATLSNPHPQDRNDVAIFNRDYKCDFASTDWNDKFSLTMLKPALEAHGINWQWLSAQATFSINPVTGKDTTDTAYLNLFATGVGVIVAYENFRDGDEQKTLPWSELMFQTWPHARDWDDRYAGGTDHPPGKPISALSTVIQLDIRNEETVNVLQTIWTAEGWEKNSVDQSWYRFTETTPSMSNWFYAILGTPNVKGTVFLLKDHAAEIGMKNIKEIWVRWPYVYPDIWIVIG